VGSPRLHAVTSRYLALEPGQSLLDVGCGPAAILAALPEIDYVGVDLSPAYIAAASARFGARGRFLAGNVYELPQLVDRRFDAVLAQGVLHHLDDDEAMTLLRFAAAKLAPGGTIVTADPCHRPGQGAFERFLMDNDRGHNIRTPDAYRALARSAFAEVRCEIRTDALRIPYSFCYVIATG